MIVTKEGKIVVSVGEPIGYEGRVWRCVQDTDRGSITCEEYCSFGSPDLKPVCEVLECRFSDRPDGLAVHFVPFGAEEGGEDGK